LCVPWTLRIGSLLKAQDVADWRVILWSTLEVIPVPLVGLQDSFAH
jgi:hypothetical protein